MFEFEEYEKRLNSSYEEAKKYCESFPNDLLAQAELVTLDMMHFNENSFLTNYQSLQRYYKLLKRSHNNISFARVASNLVFYGFDLHDLYNVREYAQNVLRIIPEYIEVMVILANVNVRLEKDVNESFEFAKRNCNNDSLSVEFRNICYNTIGEYFLFKKEFNEARNFFERSFLFSNASKEVLRNELLCLSLASLEDFSLLRQDYENYLEFLNENQKKGLLKDICDKLISTLNVDEAQIYLNELEQMELNDEDKEYVIIDKIRILGIKREFDQALSLFKSFNEEQINNNFYISYLYGTTVFLKDDYKLYDNGIKHLIKVYEKNSTDENLFNVINAMHINKDYKSMQAYLLKVKSKKHHLIFYYNAIINASKGNWDKAENQMIRYMVKNKTKAAEYLYFAKRPNAIYNAIISDYNEAKTVNGKRNEAIMYLHGFGLAKVPNPMKAKVLLEPLVGDEKFDNCCYSALGNTYLTLNEKEKAFALFEEGHRRYIEGKDSCTCSTGFYCYCKAFGEGVTANEDEAMGILNNIEGRFLSDIGVYTYAYICLKRNSNLEKAWELLENLNEWRYDIGKYFMMLKIAPLLNKNDKKIKRMFKKCLKKAPLNERIHYLSNPDIFYLTNI